MAGIGCLTHHQASAEHVSGDRFDVTRNADRLGRALRVHDARFEDGQVVVRIGSRGVGHRFPTGDIFRRLTVTLTARDASGAIIAGDTFHPSRDWDRHRDSLRRGTTEPVGEDTRLGAAPRAFRIACAQAPAPVHLAIDYARGASADGDFFDAFEHLKIVDADVKLQR